MITPGYCVGMARYNAWQNRQMDAAMASLPPADLNADRGAFFGSVMRTASHVLWADQVWMARMAGTAPPAAPGTQSDVAWTDLPTWREDRVATDAMLRDWAGALGDADLAGQVAWYSGILGKDTSAPCWLCVTHMFNHQTHHRGQIHAMLTAAGAQAPVSDLVFMPEDA
ncbi:MAG: DinB family protein [Rhodobacteraceae bacterium]|nr:DinB family protein [Paracoccaceae bacterium]